MSFSANYDYLQNFKLSIKWEEGQLNLNSEDGSDNIPIEGIVVIGLYVLQAITLITCISLRYCKFKDVGLYSLQVGRPRIYLLKHALHAIIFVSLIGIFCAFIFIHDDHSRIYRIIRLTVTSF